MMFSPYHAMQKLASQEPVSLENAKALLHENFNEQEIKSDPKLLLLAAIYLELRTSGYIHAAKLNSRM